MNGCQPEKCPISSSEFCLGEWLEKFGDKRLEAGVFPLSMDVA